MFYPAIEGFLLGGGLIIAIGAQNAFILRQGLLQQHVFILCLIAALADTFLIVLGVAGMGTLISSNPDMLFYVTVGGAIFLAGYALIALRRALAPQGLETSGKGVSSLGKAVSVLLAFTFLNPHVYLDTIVLLGGVSGQYSGDLRVAFGAGASVASFLWFFSLGYGAKWLAPLFSRPAAWRVLDGLIALIMALLSITLLVRAFG
ncbi:MAG: amino acid transporter [Rhizobiaceae bacterium]|nr:LysE/ArgO family amino acid transporter [Hyphomicrobiales bacterium]NRB31331.1 amino acid transporter [Rhizobiaceae bacterium]